MADDIPIDIQYYKLADWVQDRSSMIKKQHPQIYADVIAMAAILLRNVKYEIPALKEGINKASSGIREAESSILENQRRKQDYLLSYEKELSDLNLGGSDEDDLFRCIEEHIPKWMGNVVKVGQSQTVLDALQSYSVFMAWCHSRTSSTNPVSQLCTVLKHFASLGNTVAAEVVIPGGHTWCADDLQSQSPLLLNDITRNALVDDVQELCAFLCTRLYELNQTSSHNALITVDAPASDVSLIQQQLQAVQGLCELLQGKASTHLLMLRSSQQYRARVLTSLRLLQQKANRCHDNVSQNEEVVINLSAEIEETTPKLQELISKTKELKVTCEKLLSKVYHPREVNIIGAVNAL
eukprot:PhF_6_TR4446/c0_g1_i1/m.6021